MTDTERRLLENQYVIMDALTALLTMMPVTNVGRLLLKLADAQGRTKAEIELGMKKR